MEEVELKRTKPELGFIGIWKRLDFVQRKMAFSTDGNWERFSGQRESAVSERVCQLRNGESNSVCSPEKEEESEGISNFFNSLCFFFLFFSFLLFFAEFDIIFFSLKSSLGCSNFS